jgi:hypothetical protein
LDIERLSIVRTDYPKMPAARKRDRDESATLAKILSEMASGWGFARSWVEA